MECPDSTSIIKVNDLHILSGDIHYKQSNCSGLQTKMLKYVRNECINTGDCELDFPKTYANEECALISPYITVDFTCVPSGMYVLIWGMYSGVILYHSWLHMCAFRYVFFNEECTIVSPYITVDFTCVPQGMYLLMRNVQWCHPISQLIAHVCHKVCIC